MPRFRLYFRQKPENIDYGTYGNVNQISKRNRIRHNQGRLLSSAIKASSNPMKIVLDPFCGRGTTVAMTLYFGKKLISTAIIT